MMTSRRRHKILILCGAMALVVLLLIIALIIFSEPLVRSLTEKTGSEKIGREIAIDGPLKIDWHWNYTSIHAEEIRLSNAPDYPDPNMVTIKTLDLTFKPLKMLIGKLEFGEITLDTFTIILEKKSAEEANWNFPALSQANATTEAAAPEDRHDFPVIDRLQLKAGQIIYRDAVKDLNLDLQLDFVSGQGGEDSESTDIKEGFQVSGTGTMQQQAFKLKAAGGTLEALRDSNKKFPLKLTLLMGATEVLVDGSFQDPIKLTGIDASLKISGDNMADLFYLTAIPLPPTPPYTLEGQLTKKNGVWAYEKFKGKVGESDLSGDASFETRDERGFLRANLISHLLASEDLGGFIGLPPSGETATPEQKAAAAAKEASPKLIPDVPLKLERLRATDLDVTLKAEKIDAPSLPFKGMDVHFDLKNGLLKLDPLNVILADGSVDGSIVVDAKKDVPPMTLDLNLRNLSLGQFFKNTRFAETTEGIFGGKVKLTGSGVSLAEVLATSNGDLSIIMSDGKISLLLVEASDLDIGQALPLFLGRDKPTKIRCGVVDFEVNDGILDSKVVVLDTTDSRLIGDITIDMKSEVINAKLDAKPKDDSFLSAKTPIVVSGQLKDPAIGVDSKKALKQGATAAALGTLLTPFAALIPFIESGDKKNTNCWALINSAKNRADGE